MDNKWIILIIIIFIGIAGYIYFTTPELVVDNFHSEKYVYTTEYTSGKVEPDYFIQYGYNITQTKAIDSSMDADLKIYDKNKNLIYEKSFDYKETEILEYDYEIEVSEEIFKKADAMEFVFYKQWEDVKLYNISTKILKGEDQTHELDDSKDLNIYKSSSDSSHNNYDSYSTRDDYSVYGDYIGNSNTHKFHQSFCSWADNIKSGNRVSFSSRQDALDCGYSPCSYCNP